MLQVSLLGPLRVDRFGSEVPITATKPRTVLAMLALNAGSAVGLEMLIDELWADRPPQTAIKTAQTYVYQLRKLLRLGSEPAPETPGRFY